MMDLVLCFSEMESNQNKSDEGDLGMECTCVSKTMDKVGKHGERQKRVGSG